jgi:tetratricopeptide (TPR) repeat protein
VAGWLEANKANPARIAQHYLDAEEEAKAAPFLFEAAKKARETFLYSDALQLFRQTALLAERHGFQELSYESRLNLTQILALTDQGKQYAKAAQDLLSQARTSKQKAEAYNAYSDSLIYQGEGEESEQAARQGLKYADESADLAMSSVLMNQLGLTLWIQERFAEAIEAYKASTELQKQAGYEALLGETFTNIGHSLRYLERQGEALEYFHQAIELFRRQNRQEAVAVALVNMSVSQSDLGRVRTSTETLLEAQTILASLQGDDAQQLYCLMGLGLNYNDLCDYQKALEHLKKAESLANKLGGNFGSLIHSYLAQVFTVLGGFKQAEACLERFFEATGTLKQQQGKGFLRLAQLRHAQQLPSQDSLNKAKTLLRPSGRPQHLGYWNLQQALLQAPKKALPHVEQTLESARNYELYGLVIAAKTRLAQVILQLKQNIKAKEHSAEAIRLLGPYDPVDFYRGEALFTHYQTLKANKDKGANGWLAQTLAWLMDIANNKVPLEYRESFLTHNPVNKAILDEVTMVGLELPTP